MLLEWSKFILIIELSALWILSPLKLTLKNFVIPDLLLSGILHLRKVCVPVDTFEGIRIFNVSVELSEYYAEALQYQTLCVGLIYDRMRLGHGQGASQLDFLGIILLDHPGQHSVI